MMVSSLLALIKFGFFFTMMGFFFFSFDFDCELELLDDELDPDESFLMDLEYIYVSSVIMLYI